jgi:hypothetical protein
MLTYRALALLAVGFNPFLVLLRQLVLLDLRFANRLVCFLQCILDDSLSQPIFELKLHSLIVGQRRQRDLIGIHLLFENQCYSQDYCLLHG